jgi:uncharacterized protein YjiS (DUF1127 family)
MFASTNARSEAAGGGTLRVLPDFLGRVAGGIRHFVTVSRAERQLESLDDRLLADIGLRRSEIHRMVWGARR